MKNWFWRTEGCETYSRHPRAAAGIPSLGRPDAVPTIVEKAGKPVVFHIGAVDLVPAARRTLRSPPIG